MRVFFLQAIGRDRASESCGQRLRGIHHLFPHQWLNGVNSIIGKVIKCNIGELESILCHVAILEAATPIISTSKNVHM